MFKMLIYILIVVIPFIKLWISMTQIAIDYWKIQTNLFKFCKIVKNHIFYLQCDDGIWVNGIFIVWSDMTIFVSSLQHYMPAKRLYIAIIYILVFWFLYSSETIKTAIDKLPLT